MTAQLEAMAIAARLDLLAYFLGMAKAESEIYVRTNAVAEAERMERNPTSPRTGCLNGAIPSIEKSLRVTLRSANAQRDAVA